MTPTSHPQWFPFKGLPFRFIPKTKSQSFPTYRTNKFLRGPKPKKDKTQPPVQCGVIELEAFDSCHMVTHSVWYALMLLNQEVGVFRVPYLAVAFFEAFGLFFLGGGVSPRKRCREKGAGSQEL